MIPVYNVDGSPNEARYITEAVDLMVQYKDHSEDCSFHITSIGWTTILGHMWLMAHNPDIDWHTGEVHMTRCLVSCGSAGSTIWLSNEWAEKDEKHLEAKPCCWVCIKRSQKHCLNQLG